MTVQDTPTDPGRPTVAPETAQTAVERRTAQSGVGTPGCDCGHDGMGVGWHGTDCAWRARTTPDNPATSGDAVDNCCVCGGGRIVYRSYRDQPFCGPCADCGCGETPCVRTGINDPAVSSDAALREQFAARAALVRDQAALAQVRLLIGAYRKRLKLADPILLARLEQAVAQVGELEPAEVGDRP